MIEDLRERPFTGAVIAAVGEGVDVGKQVFPRAKIEPPTRDGGSSHVVSPVVPKSRSGMGSERQHTLRRDPRPHPAAGRLFTACEPCGRHWQKAAITPLRMPVLAAQTAIGAALWSDLHSPPGGKACRGKVLPRTRGQKRDVRNMKLRYATALVQPFFLASFFLVATLHTATAAPISGLYIFGDSLSDPGNNALLFNPPPSPPNNVTLQSDITGNSFIPTYPYASS